MKTSISVHEVFTSLQGEGTHIGIPTTFLRLVGCNKDCSWCDTGYGDNKIKIPVKEMTCDEVLFEIVKYPANWVCITGGEPFMHSSSDLDRLVIRLHDAGFRISCETNASIQVPPNGALWPLLIDHIATSPKLPSSRCPITKDELLAFARIWHKNMELKFVVMDIGDVKYAQELMEFLKEHGFDVPTTFTPVHGALKDVIALYGDTAKLFQDCDVRYLPQMHKALDMQ